MVRRPKDVTTAELAILEKLWEAQTATVAQLAQQLYGASTPSEIATVQKLLARLEAKGWVVRDRNQWPHQFQAAMAREQLISQRLQSTADELCDGTMDSLLTHLINSQDFKSKDRKRLRQLLDELDNDS